MVDISDYILVKFGQDYTRNYYECYTYNEFLLNDIFPG